MSYYTQHFAQQQNPQHKTLRLFLVVAVHIILIFGLANALTYVSKHKPDPVTDIRIIDQPTPPPTPIAPIEPTDRPIKPTDWNLPQIIIEGPQPKFVPPSVIDSGGGIIATSTLARAILKRAPKPEYPSAAARLEEQGTTGMKLLISTDGRVANAEVIQSSGSARLDEAAVKHAMSTWLFSPCTENGKAVSCEQNMRLKWQLEDAKR